MNLTKLQTKVLHELTTDSRKRLIQVDGVILITTPDQISLSERLSIDDRFVSVKTIASLIAKKQLEREFDHDTGYRRRPDIKVYMLSKNVSK